MSVLEVTFPDEWLTVSVRSPAAAAHPVSARAVWARSCGPPQGDWRSGAFRPVAALDVDDLASLALPEQRTGDGIQAFCAIGVVSATGRDDELRFVAEGGRHPGLERDTLSVQLSVGTGVRSSAFRFADELLDAPDLVPFTAEIRFALPLPGRRIGVLHFETFSLRGFEELEGLFDIIAGTARVV